MGCEDLSLCLADSTCALGCWMLLWLQASPLRGCLPPLAQYLSGHASQGSEGSRDRRIGKILMSYQCPQLQGA